MSEKSRQGLIVLIVLISVAVAMYYITPLLKPAIECKDFCQNYYGCNPNFIEMNGYIVDTTDYKQS